jgi:hypothetical protein
MKEHNENNLYDFSNQKYIELNPDMFDKFIPEELRTKILKIINGILSKYRNEYHSGATRFLTNRLHPGGIKNIPPSILDIQEIYEINFVPLQFLFNLLSLNNIDPASLTILVWGCGFCAVDYYLDRLGFNIISYDNWSQLPKNIPHEFLLKVDNNIKLVDNVEELYDMTYDIIIDTGNFMSDPKILRNQRLKYIFTWMVGRLDKESDQDTTPNLNYLMENFQRINMPLNTIFIKN